MNLVVKRGIVAGFATVVASMLFQQLFQIIFPSVTTEYQNISIFRPWTDPLMMLFFAYPFILGLVLAYFWEKVKGLLNGDEKQKIFEFAKLYFVIAGLPGMFVTWTSFQVSALMVICWTIAGFIDAYVAGWVFSKIKK